MPSICLFQNSADATELAAFFFDQGFFFVPDLWYETPNTVEVHDKGAFDPKQARQFLLVNNDIMHSPLVTHEVSGGYYMGKFAISHVRGGPYLAFSCFLPFEDSGVLTFSVSVVSYLKELSKHVNRRFRSRSRGSRAQIPIGVSVHKKNAAAAIHQECYGGTSRVYWLMEGAADDLRRGARLGVKGLEDYKVAPDPA